MFIEMADIKIIIYIYFYFFVTTYPTLTYIHTQLQAVQKWDDFN